MHWKSLAPAILLASAAAQGAVIEGYVVENLTGRPLARSRVALVPLGAGVRSGAPVFTDSTGHFLFASVGAGAFVLMAEKRGYATASFGQKRWNGPGTPVVVERDSRFAAEIRLSRFGAVSGTVVDENGVGIPTVQVSAYKDGRPLRLAGQSSSDDRGVFRIAGLEPGAYRVRTGPKQLEDQSGLLPTYFGDSAGVDGSIPVMVRLDDETGGLIVEPAPGKLLRVSGRVNVPGAGTVALYADMGRWVTTPDAAGRFSFDELTPGHVELIAESTGPGRGQVGYASLWLSTDQDSVVLDPAPAPVVYFRCEVGDGRFIGTSDVSLSMVRTSPAEDPRSQQIDCGGSAPASVGSWQVSVFTPPRYTVTEFQIQRRASGSNSLTLLPGQTAEILLSLSARGAAYKGKVLGPSEIPAVGAMVFLKPVDQSVARLLFGKGVARTGANGEFAFEGLPPGRYKVAGSFDAQTVEEVDWSNTSLETVELEVGGTHSSEVRLSR